MLGSTLTSDLASTRFFKRLAQQGRTGRTGRSTRARRSLGAVTTALAAERNARCRVRPVGPVRPKAQKGNAASVLPRSDLSISSLNRLDPSDLGGRAPPG